MIAAAQQAIIWDVTAEEYHGNFRYVSNSMLNVFRQSRQRYYQRFVARSIEAKPPTDAMIRGTLLHLLKLESSKWPSAFVQVPDLAPDGKKWLRRKGSDHERMWAEFLEASKGKLLCDNDTMADVQGMAAALLANPVSRALIEAPGEVERSITWHDADSGLDLKMRADKINANLILDLKTTSDVSPRGFANKVASFGYHRQAQFYQQGQAHLTGEILPFVFVAVESESPYSVATYELDDEALRLAENQNRSALQQLAACIRNNDWHAPESKRINQLSLPKWTVYAEEWEIIE